MITMRLYKGELTKKSAIKIMDIFAEFSFAKVVELSQHPNCWGLINIDDLDAGFAFGFVEGWIAALKEHKIKK